MVVTSWTMNRHMVTTVQRLWKRKVYRPISSAAHYLIDYHCSPLAPPMPDERPTCEECKKKFAVSYLLSKFQLSVCDSCRYKVSRCFLIIRRSQKSFMKPRISTITNTSNSMCCTTKVNLLIQQNLCIMFCMWELKLIL